MSNTLENPEELTVSKLFTSGQYIIPMYQRNYAWGKVEIEQLLQDLMDAASSKQVHKKDYYLGSLVVHQRKDGKFEIIDGQQRHTTLCILMAVLKNELKTNGVSQSINLAFEHRDLSSETLKLLFEKGIESNAPNMEPAMVAAYKVAHTFLYSPDNRKVLIDVFADFISKHAKLLRVIVPEDTDLNHYFEIMNSRGEQLEKHEVLKVRLMKDLEPEGRNAFAKIWDACADMSRYVQLGFSTNERVTVFGFDWNQCTKGFDDLVKLLSDEASGNKGAKLEDILQQPQLNTKLNNEKDTENKDGKYGSIINFPNFLLQVLLVLHPNNSIPLDDKTLLDSFEEHPKYKEDSAKFAKDFIVALLQMRYLFDSWVIKTTSEADHWRLRIIKPAEKSSHSFVNSVQNETDKKSNDQLIMILSMRHVSFPSQNYKQWLKEALGYLYENRMQPIDGIQYLVYLEGLSDAFFKARCTDDNVLHNGTGVQHFFFNRLDYLLWKKIVIGGEMPNIGNDKAIDVNKLAKDFKFTFRSSVEHFYPQNPREPNVPKIENCDRFGNLCLISNHHNSRYSDFLPTAKKELHAASRVNESLKQMIMMSYDDWGPSEQGLKNIKNHEEEMIALLKAPQHEYSTT